MAPLLAYFKGQIMKEMASTEDEVIGLIQILKDLECHHREFRFDLLGGWNY